MRLRSCLIVLLVSGFASLAHAVQAVDQIVNDQMPGWTLRGKEQAAWVVKDGVLECTGGGKAWGEWWGTQKEYTDCIVELDYKLTPGGNSGIYLRCPAQGHPSAVAFEIQLLDDNADKHKNLVPAQFSGSVYKIVAPSKRADKPIGEWNHIRVVADGEHLIVVLNGETVVDATAAEYPEIRKRSTRGFIGLQNHHTQCWFRNIKITDLAEDRAQRSAWFRDAKFGMFIHWGVYSVLGEGEWNMKVSKIPAAEYEKLPPQFNPTAFNAAEWVSLAKRAGQKYIVLTSKHHDGFAMYDSKVSNYDIMDATPFKRDPVKEIAAECGKQGMRFGLYHSILDWHQPMYEPAPEWDPARKDKKGDFDKYLEYMTAQTKELCTGYGPLACWWWDGVWGHEGDRAKLAAINGMIRELQPGILINNRAANAEDFDTPEQYIPPTGITGPDGSPKLWENCITLTTGHGSHAPTAWWGYDRNEKEFKTAEYSIRMLVDVVSKGGNLLLNVGPSPEGKIGKAETEVLEAMGRWLDVNGEAIYGTTASPFKHLPFYGRATVKGDTLYVHVFGWPSERRVAVPGLTNNVKNARLLDRAGGQSLTVSREGASTIIALPEKAPDPVASVIALQLDGPPKVEPFTTRPEADGSFKLPATIAVIQAVHGQKARFDTIGDQVYVANWTNGNDGVAWQFEVEKAGKYELILNYAAEQASADGAVEVGFVTPAALKAKIPQLENVGIGSIFDAIPAATRLQAPVQPTGGAKDFKDNKIGAIELSAGPNLLFVRPAKLPSQGGLMNLKAANLKPAQ